MNNSHFLRNSLNTFAINIVILIVSFFTSILTARILGPEGKGQLSLLILIPTFCAAFGRLGIGHAVNYYASKICSTKLIVNSFAITLIITFLMIVILSIAVNIFENYFLKAGDNTLQITMIVSLPFYIFNALFLSLFQGFYKISVRNLMLVIQSLLSIIFLLFALIVFKLGLIGALISIILAQIFVVTWSLYYLLKYINLKDFNIELSIIRKIVSYGLKSHIGNVFKDLSYRIDILIIGYFLTAADIGYYVIAVTISEIIWKGPDAVGSVLLPRIGQMDSTNVKLLTPLVCRTILVPIFFVCMVIAFFCGNIVAIFFGSDFLPAVPIIILLLPGILSLSIWKILANDLIAQGHAAVYSLTSCLAFIIMFVCDLVLIPMFGLKGAAIASTISYIAATVSIIYSYTKISKNSFKLLIFPQRSDFLLCKNLIKGA